MRKVRVGLAVLLLGVVPSFGQLDVGSVFIDGLQGDGMDAVYDHITQTITWSGGASVSLYSSYNGSGGYIASFDTDISIDAEFTILDDQSSGDLAKGSFAAVDWSVSIFGVPVIWGTNVVGEEYLEEEQTEALPFPPFTVSGNGILAGSGVVQVTGNLFSFLDPDYVWNDDNGVARMKSLVTGEASFDSYLTDDYSSIVTTMWIYADETVIPEPATMVLLGLGSLLVLRKRS